MKSEVINSLISVTNLSKKEIENLIEIPSNSDLGDFAFPCFSLAKKEKKSPLEISKDLSLKINSNFFESIKPNGPYLNFFLDKNKLATELISEIFKKRDKYGSSKIGKGKTIVIDLSSPNIAKPFGIGHLRSTIIGNSIGEIAKFNGYKTIKINYLGDWGTQFGKLIIGFKKFGNNEKLKKDPIKHLLEIYIKINKNKEYDEESRQEFKKLESSDKENLNLWKKFRDLSIKQFNEIYETLGIKFDITSGESFYNDKMSSVVKELQKKKLLEDSDGAKIVNLKDYNLGVAIIKKSDGTSIYTTRDLAAAIYRTKKYKASSILYEVGSEQNLHFKQLFKILKLLGYKWAENLNHIGHGLYLGTDGKRFATRKGKTIFMSEILENTINLAKKEISKREKLPPKELEDRAKTIAISAIIYGDLKNYRLNNIIFDINRFIEFEGNTGPYLLYTYSRARSILRKAKYKQKKITSLKLSNSEKSLILELNKFKEVVSDSFNSYAPNLIANYSYLISQKFNEFYHAEKVIGSESEDFKLALVSSFSIVLKNSLSLLGIPVLEKM